MSSSCLAVLGAHVSLATSSDTRYPPDSVIDGNPDTFWMTTGLFPQEIIIAFPEVTTVSAVLTKTANVRRMVIEGSEESEGPDFTMFKKKELASGESGRIQSEELKLDSPQSIRRLKVVFTEGYDHFAAIYSIHATG